MKKITLLFALALFGTQAQAQETEDQDYNHWSIEAGFGMTEPGRGFENDNAGAAYNSSFTSSLGGELAVRYMINDKFGLKLGGHYSKINEDDESLAFETTYSRATLEAVANLGSILGFREWTNGFNLLFHAGGGVAFYQFGDDAIYADENDSSPVFMAGITPQIRLSDRVALYGDITYAGHLGQTYTWEGNQEVNTIRSFESEALTAAIGIQVYLGKHSKHADWVDIINQKELTQELDSIQNRLSKIEDDMLDSDMDGVPNYLDREPNTTNGVAVDTNGRAVDTNNNGIPDELEASLEKRYMTKEKAAAQNAGSGTIKSLINDGYVNVYFEFNSTNPEVYSYEAINYLITYMRQNPSAKASLTGYADEIGNPQYNLDLSKRRAKKVYDILVASGISEDRLSHDGEGIDDSVDKSSAEARQLVRRVTFKLH
ncbi:OmpA family protein [Mesonia sp. HuA40]|uniref:OmpA family protein n=1 Tax=Mesonia sp. HuA40 TaxID=2602761 RepID=UPI0011C917DB|nr:OmpA family protein [Mesonia sp. HuA40]TXK74042.1 OmpA family protein [Mesonia sp. HuA40]